MRISWIPLKPEVQELNVTCLAGDLMQTCKAIQGHIWVTRVHKDQDHRLPCQVIRRHLHAGLGHYLILRLRSESVKIISCKHLWR